MNGGLQPRQSTFSGSMVFTESGGTYRDLVSGATAHERATLDQATIGFSYADDETITVEADGLHTAGGLRLRF